VEKKEGECKCILLFFMAMIITEGCDRPLKEHHSDDHFNVLEFLQRKKFLTNTFLFLTLMSLSSVSLVFNIQVTVYNIFKRKYKRLSVDRNT